MHFNDTKAVGAAKIVIPLALLLCAVLAACMRREIHGFPAALGQGMTIEVTGARYRWQVRYPGDDGRLGTGDDFFRHQPIVLPQGIPTRIRLMSEDYLYGFELPDFGIYEMAVPELTFSLSLTASQTGRFSLRGNQMCGYTHPDLLGEIRVASRTEFARWWAEGQGK